MSLRREQFLGGPEERLVGVPIERLDYDEAGIRMPVRWTL